MESMHKIEQHIKAVLSSYKGSKIHVAVSGGMDSICLLFILHKLGFNIKAIHVNYHLRGDESDQDQQFVEQFCKDHSIPLEVKEVDTHSFLKDGGNLQQIARDIRYKWFEEICNKSPDNLIALAHHADDQVETFFLQLARNSGIMGLSCMLEINDQLIRPLLSFSRSDIEQYITEEGLIWREDSSNRSLKYSRNKLRNAVLPELRSLIPSLDEDVLTLIGAFQRKQKELEETITPVTDEIKNTLQIPMHLWSNLNEFEQIELLRQLSIHLSYHPEILKLLDGIKGKYLDLQNSAYHRIYKEKDALSLHKEPIEQRAILYCIEVKQLPTTFSKDILYLDKDKLSGELNVRTWQAGDRIASVGMNGSQLISDITKDAGIDAGKKSQVLVVHDNNDIHWCVGLKVGRKALADSASEHILRCQIINDPESGE